MVYRLLTVAQATRALPKKVEDPPLQSFRGHAQEKFVATLQ